MGRNQITAICAAAILLLIGASVSAASLRTRSCGVPKVTGYPIHVRATPNVSCAQAGRLMPEVIDGSRCYHGGRFHPCRLEGFYCTLQSASPNDQSSGRCTKRRNELIVGRT